MLNAAYAATWPSITRKGIKPSDADSDNDPPTS
ncbi:TPA: DUF3470 domain-containing protein [Stenotrophomonas maltophilia]